MTNQAKPTIEDTAYWKAQNVKWANEDNLKFNDELLTAKVGDGATICLYSDSHACTIIKHTGKKITVQRDKATLLNGTNSNEKDALEFSPGGFVCHTSGRQRYSYERDEDGSTATYSRRYWENKHGKKYVRWVLVGSNKDNGQTIISGRHEHYDYNF